MTLPIPDLDDRDFDQLAGEARALIPRNLPAWTDHNPSDPGITLQELFAFLVEISIYQVNRVPDRSLRRFADLGGHPVGTRARFSRRFVSRASRGAAAARKADRRREVSAAEAARSAEDHERAATAGRAWMSPARSRDLAESFP